MPRVWKTRIPVDGSTPTRAEYPGMNPRPISWELRHVSDKHEEWEACVWVECAAPTDKDAASTTWLEFLLHPTGAPYADVWTAHSSQVAEFPREIQAWHLLWAVEGR